MQRKETELSPAPDPRGMKGILCWRWWLTPSPPVRDHRFTGLPSADIAAFHLSEEGQLLLGSESVKAGQGVETQWCVLVICRRFDDGHESRYAASMAVDWQKIKCQLFWSFVKRKKKK